MPDAFVIRDQESIDRIRRAIQRTEGGLGRSGSASNVSTTSRPFAARIEEADREDNPRRFSWREVIWSGTAGDDEMGGWIDKPDGRTSKRDEDRFAKPAVCLVDLVIAAPVLDSIVHLQPRIDDDDRSRVYEFTPANLLGRFFLAKVTAVSGGFNSSYTAEAIDGGLTLEGVVPIFGRPFRTQEVDHNPAQVNDPCIILVIDDAEPPSLGLVLLTESVRTTFCDEGAAATAAPAHAAAARLPVADFYR